MRSKLIFFTSILLLILACKSYAPFSSVKEKNEKVNLIKSKFQLTNKEFKKIKKEDSILFTIAKSLKKNIKLNLIERRLDSFFLNNYTKEQLLTILKLDYNFPNLKKPFELNSSKDAAGFEIKNMSEMKKFINGGVLDKQLDSVFGMKKKDSLKKKKN